MDTELADIKKQKLEQNTYIRSIEQKNDDLERARRIVEESIHGIEAALNAAIERNAILESEVDDKERLKEKLQRLADETRGMYSIDILILTTDACETLKGLLTRYFSCF